MNQEKLYKLLHLSSKPLTKKHKYHLFFIFCDDGKSVENDIKKYKSQTKCNSSKIFIINNNWEGNLVIENFEIISIKINDLKAQLPKVLQYINPMYIEKYASIIEAGFENKFIELSKFFKSQVINSGRRFKTAALSSKMWFRNLINNTRNLLKSEMQNKEISEILMNRKIIVTGASSKLEEEIDKIKIGIKNNFLLLAMDNSLWFLKNHGIRPDIIISLDSRPFVRTFFPNDFKSIPSIVPITLDHTLFNQLENKYVFNPGFPNISSLFNLNEHATINNLFNKKIPHFDTSISNIGAFCASFINLFSPLAIMYSGADYTIHHYKMYHKEAYQYKFIRQNTNYLLPLQDFALKATIDKKDDKMLQIYKKEFLEASKKSLIQTQPNQDINYFPIISYFYLKHENLNLATKQAKDFVQSL